MSGTETKEEVGTKKALIEAATALFAESGFEGVSLRDITGKAEANVASVKYHFGSKDGLIDAVVAEHVRPVNEERLRRIGELEAGKKVVRVKDLLRAFMEPLVLRVSESELSERLFCKLMGRLMGERPYEFPAVVMGEFREVAERFVGGFGKALPKLSEEEIFWRIHFSFGVMSTTLMHGEILRKISGGKVKREELEETLDRVIEYCEAGFRKGGGK